MQLLDSSRFPCIEPFLNRSGDKMCKERDLVGILDSGLAPRPLTCGQKHVDPMLHGFAVGIPCRFRLQKLFFLNQSFCDQRKCFSHKCRIHGNPSCLEAK